ncbi:PadR family transcriptional regulator, partial [bacterium]|nr:PadR family transcriptional regulator [bacterium]
AEAAILTLINEGETHGYALNETIEYRGFRNWTDIGFSSIYAILNRLKKKRFITSRLDSSSQGPARKLYKITGKGKRVLLKAIRLYLSEPEPPRARIDIGAAYLNLIPQEEAIRCLETYREKLLNRIKHAKKVREQQQPLPFGAEIIFDHGIVKGSAELRWVESVIRKIKTRKE